MTRSYLGYVSSQTTDTIFAGTYGTATGGVGSPTAVTISGTNYEYLTFTATGTLTVTKAGLFDYCSNKSWTLAHRQHHRQVH